MHGIEIPNTLNVSGYYAIVGGEGYRDIEEVGRGGPIE
jgi:hypothetical protein